MNNEISSVEVQGTANAMQIAKGIVNYIVEHENYFDTVDTMITNLGDEVTEKVSYDILDKLNDKFGGNIPTGTTFTVTFEEDWYCDRYKWFSNNLFDCVATAHQNKDYYNSLPDEMKVYCDILTKSKMLGFSDKDRQFLKFIQMHTKAYFEANYGWDFDTFEYYLKQVIKDKELPIEYNGLVGSEYSSEMVGLKIEFVCK